MTDHLPSTCLEARKLKREWRKKHRAELVQALKDAGPRTVYAGLLGLQQEKKYKRGWVAWCFKELFGGWPRPQSRVEAAEPSDELLEWYYLRPKGRRKVKPEDQKVLVVEKPKPLLVINGLVAGTLMRPEDMEVEWR